jgi:hypothetical protein
VEERFAQAIHGVIEVMVEIDERIGRPKFLSELLAQNQLTGTLQWRF